MPYIYYNPNPARKDTIDCTVRAISKLIDMDWDTTYLKLSVQGFVASGNTVLFVNFNTNRMCFKSTNQNGVPMALRWATFTYDETQQQAQNFQMQNQNSQDSVSRQEFDELKAMLAQALAPNQDQQQFTPQQAYQQRKYGKRGNRNDGSANAPADNG